MQKRELLPVSRAHEDERVGAALRTIFERDDGAIILIHPYRDDEFLCVSVSATIAGERRSTEQESLLSALHSVMGHAATKMCMKCERVKLLSQFCRNRSQTDGHGARCKQCERERQAAFNASKKKRSARDAAMSGPSPAPTASTAPKGP